MTPSNLPRARNPVLGWEHFVPDVEARQGTDGRLYLYGSRDIRGKADWCSTEYHVHSSADLVHWTDHGTSFKIRDVRGEAADSSTRLWAPDCIRRDDTWYLYYCLSSYSTGVAVGHSPSGPFHDGRPLGLDNIDPAAFLDDDGQGYLFWGQNDLMRAAKLTPDLLTIDTNSIVQPLNVKDHHFHEGGSIRKRNGVYYFLYADTSRRDSRPTCLGYSTAPSPLGPYTYRGIIIDNYGCDPQVWNNHGCLTEFHGDWFVVYHRSTRNGVFSRRVCMEKIRFEPDGSIPEVEMTSQGAGEPFDPTVPLEAALACQMSGSVRLDDGPDGEHLCEIHDGDWAAFRYLDFDCSPTKFEAVVSSGAFKGATMELRLDSPQGPLIGECAVPYTGSGSTRVTVRVAVTGALGVRALYLVFRGGAGALMTVRRFRFLL